MPELPPEQLAREQIDAQLKLCGWSVQDYDKYNPSVSLGVALREVPVKGGRCDYLLLINRKPAGIIEAKKAGTTLSAVAEQSEYYGKNLPDFFQLETKSLRFYYESTGIETFFRDGNDPEPRSRRVFSFHRPETLSDWIEQPETLRGRLMRMVADHPLITDGMRDCQIEAITKLEKSFAKDKPRALIQMATGSGKTYTACSFVYRLIKYAGAKRILFLVDRKNLGRQTLTEFQQFSKTEDGRKFTELFNIQQLQGSQIDRASRVTISTIQRLYSILRGEELAEDVDELSGFELNAADDREREVVYNPDIPIESFDFIITDECHRSIYNSWRQVLEYFDAHLIGLTATPSKQTIGFFNQNLVMEYGHERAVADGVNVGYEVYSIKTQVTEQGGKIEKGFYVDKRHRETRKVRWEKLEEDLPFGAGELDRSVVVPSQIRTVIQAFKEAVETDLFPGRDLIPKTLVFAKDDSHAEDIVHIIRDVFGKGNDFAKKITYKTWNTATNRNERPDHLIQEFRTSPQLRIAVTVDMIATGTDIRPLECLLFMRDVRSRVYFEQMKGRGTRVLSPTELQSVSGQDANAKTHFVIVDAVGVCESDKTDSRPLERAPTVAFDKLMLRLALGQRDEDSITSLAGRLARLDRELKPDQKKEIEKITNGAPLRVLINHLLDAVDPDKIGSSEETKKKLIETACAPFDNPDLREKLAQIKRENEQTIDVVTIDRITQQGFDSNAKESAQKLVQSFRDYIEQHKAEITALQILYNRPYRERLTETALKELEQKLRKENAAWNEEMLWKAFSLARPEKVRGKSALNRFADLVPLVRFALERQPVLEPFADSVRQRFENWLAQKKETGVIFTADQRAWLELIRDQIATTLSIEIDDFDSVPFNQIGGLGKAHQLFGGELEELLNELNEVLAA